MWERSRKGIGQEKPKDEVIAIGGKRAEEAKNEALAAGRIRGAPGGREGEEEMGAIVESKVNTLARSLGKLEDRISQIEDQAAAIGAMDARVAKIDERMSKLASLYETATSQYNPFIETAPLEGPAPPSAGAPVVPGVERLTIIGKDYRTRMILLRWIEFLLKHVPRERIPELLSYYEDIGWIGEDVKYEVIDLVKGERGITSPEEKEWRLSVDDHARSLLFIEELKGHKVGSDEVKAITREIERITGGSYGV